jgi:hypothetical protein
MHCEVREELLDLLRAKHTRIPAVMKPDVALQPLEVRLLRAQGEMARAHSLARQSEKSRISLPPSL